MRALSNREKLLTTVVAIALLVTLVQKLVLAPQKRRLHQAQQELSAANDMLSSLAVKLAGFNAVRQEVLSKEQKLAALNQRLSPTREPAEVIRRLTEQARIHGLRLQYLRPQETETIRSMAGKPSKFRLSEMELGIRCRYEELGRFMAALEEKRFFVRIAALSVERGQAQPPLLDVRLRVAMVVRS